MEKSLPTLKVFFDGGCVVCSREIRHYQSLIGADSIEFIDFDMPHFDAGSFNLQLDSLRKSLHGIVESRVTEGLETFVEIWNRIPRYRFLTKIVSNKWLKPLFLAGYGIFTRVRPYLPRNRRTDCSGGNCKLGG